MLNNCSTILSMLMWFYKYMRSIYAKPQVVPWLLGRLLSSTTKNSCLYIQSWNCEMYFEELLKVSDRGELHDIISEFALEPQVSMHWSWASYTHESSCNTFYMRSWCIQWWSNVLVHYSLAVKTTNIYWPLYKIP